MTKPEEAQIILKEINNIYPFPGYYKEDIQTAIVKGLVMIEREEANRVNTEIITIEDCIEAAEMRGFGVILHNGQVKGFEGKEEENA